MLKTVVRPYSIALFSLLLLACSERPAATFQGYAEGEFLHIAAPFAGALEKLSVSRGQQVASGAALFALEAMSEQAALREAQERVGAAAARLANLEAGRRGSEVDAIRAQGAQANAVRELSANQLAQQENLFKQGFISKAKLDEARANSQRDLAKVAEMEAQARTAKASVGREAEINAARYEIEVAKAALAQSEWKLAQKTVSSPAAALVQDTFFSPGEWVPAGSPVVSLLPPGKIKVRFFVPEASLGSLKMGQNVTLTCNGCGEAINAVVSFISPQAEFTPPVIYSQDSRTKLVFYVEARPAADQATRLHPGQPVDVTLK